MSESAPPCQVYKASAAAGFLHSPVPDPQNFILGICSEEEVAAIAAALAPAEENIVKAHLVDIADGVAGPALRLRGLDGVEFERPVPAGSFVINCTDHITEVLRFICFSQCILSFILSFAHPRCVHSRYHPDTTRLTCKGANGFEPIVSKGGRVLAPQVRACLAWLPPLVPDLAPRYER